jgi:ABC-type multidrug transport system fused ATPase/permease subunit
MLVELGKLRELLERRDILQFGLVFAAILFTALFEVVGIAAILPFMRLVAQPETLHTNEWLSRIYTAAGFTSERTMLIWMGVAVIVLVSISRLSAAFTVWLTNRSVWSMAHRLSVRLLERYLQLPYEFFLTHNSAELLKKLVADVNNLVTGVLLAGSTFIAQLVVALSIFSLLLIVQPRLALVAFGLFGGAYLLLHLVRHTLLTRLGRERIAADNVRFRTFSEALTGIKAIRTEGAGNYFLDRFEAASKRFTGVQPKIQLVSLIPRYIIEILAFGGILAIVLYLLVTGGEIVSAIPMLSLFALAAYRMLPALHEAFLAGAQVSQNLPAIDEVYEDMAGEAVIETILEPEPARMDMRDRISLRSVSFQYSAGQLPVVSDIDIEIPRRSRVAFVGSTGAGKSTLVDIVVGLLMPQKGDLCVDDVPINSDNVASWLRLVAYVPQEVFLYDATVTENIAFGLEPEEIDGQRVREAARIAQLDSFIAEEMPSGYDTLIGERGVRLSGGQRQRLGLARAIYRRPEVLILDEATSALDGITEEALLSSLHNHFPDLTVIMIAHRLSTVKLCHAIHLIEQGRIVDSGTYAELLASNRTFQRMVQRTS